SPFGVNTFLEQEVEPAKRDRQLQMIQDAGFKWIRQQFPWADIEISAKGNFDDCRNPPCISAWTKYDNIVELAAEHQINIVARLDAPPNWARSTPGDFAPPANLNDYADYVAAVATRYKGKIKFYQIWNEPNNYPEWGEQPVDPEAFTQLLCMAYQRIKQIDPEANVIAPALTPTISLDPGPGPNTGLNEFIFLQRMYDANAGQCFDIMSAQGYGLFTGPTDRRLRPRVVNFSRPMYIRDIMVKNGDAHKPIWISEMNWNSVPDSIANKRFGQVTLDHQARYLPIAYDRIQTEYPWVGVAFTWYFKPATNAEKDQSKYYFRLVDPDFTPLPVYDAIKTYANQFNH
ncbi:MAG TPA: cellulase family glycosylhydrolase, partial [Anaerolineae bacterium]|nr:cellulase family glycosylhydrolase [Anaerolineae bacterium]